MDKQSPVEGCERPTSSEETQYVVKWALESRFWEEHGFHTILSLLPVSLLDPEDSQQDLVEKLAFYWSNEAAAHAEASLQEPYLGVLTLALRRVDWQEVVIQVMEEMHRKLDKSTPDAPAMPALIALKSVNPRRTMAINAFANGKLHPTQCDVSIHAISVYNAYKSEGGDDA